MPDIRTDLTEQAFVQTHSEAIDGTTYEVTSNYVGSIKLLDLFKLMLQRDIEKEMNKGLTHKSASKNNKKDQGNSYVSLAFLV